MNILKDIIDFSKGITTKYPHSESMTEVLAEQIAGLTYNNERYLTYLIFDDGEIGYPKFKKIPVTGRTDALCSVGYYTICVDLHENKLYESDIDMEMGKSYEYDDVIFEIKCVP